jgi:hypothetical protein
VEYKIARAQLRAFARINRSTEPTQRTFGQRWCRGPEALPTDSIDKIAFDNRGLLAPILGVREPLDVTAKIA